MVLVGEQSLTGRVSFRFRFESRLRSEATRPDSTLLCVHATNIRSVNVDLTLRHDPVVIGVSSVEVIQKCVDISMWLLLAKSFHFFTRQFAVYIMICSIPS